MFVNLPGFPTPSWKACMGRRLNASYCFTWVTNEETPPVVDIYCCEQVCMYSVRAHKLLLYAKSIHDLPVHIHDKSWRTVATLTTVVLSNLLLNRVKSLGGTGQRTKRCSSERRWNVYNSILPSNSLHSSYMPSVNGKQRAQALLTKQYNINDRLRQELLYIQSW